MSAAKVYRVNHPSTPWQVQVYIRGGKRLRKHFKRKQDAEAYAADLNKQARHEGTEGLLFGAAARAEYMAAKELLEGSGVGLVEAVRQWAGKHGNRGGRVEWSGAVLEFLEEKERGNRAAKTIANIKHRLSLFERFSGAKLLRDVTESEVRAFLAQSHFSARTRASYRIALHGFCAWAVRRRYLRENPVRFVEAPILDKGRARILSGVQVGRLLAVSAGIAGGRIVPRVALLALAGIRPGEVDQLRPENILPDGIRVAAGKIRGRRAVRIVPLSDALRGWLELYGTDFKPSNFRRLLDRAIDEAGLRREWQQDILRHTWISHRLAEVSDESRVAREAGNSPGVIFADYFQLVTAEEGRAYGRFSVIG